MDRAVVDVDWSVLMGCDDTDIAQNIRCKAKADFFIQIIENARGNSKIWQNMNK